MTELQPAAEISTTSTELHPSADTTQNPLSYKPEAAPEKPEAPKLSSRQALEKAQAEITKPAEVKAEEKPEPPKPDTTQKPVPENPPPAAKAEEAKPTSEPPPSEAKGNEQDGKPEPRSSEDRDIEKPPARFLPRAKEKWGTVDPDVRGEVHRALSEMEKGMGEYKESHEFRKEIREYEDMAKQAGVPLKEALKNYVELDNLVASNPVAGVARILGTQGIDVVQFAQHVLGQAAQQTPESQQQAQLHQHIQGLEQTVQHLTKKIEEAEQTSRTSETINSVIAPFRQSLGANDRFEELEGDIALFLNSGKIPFDMPAQQKLAVAYDYAERINPSPVSSSQGSSPETSALRPLNPAGQKSIKGPPSPGAESTPRDKGRVSTRDALKAAASELGVRI